MAFDRSSRSGGAPLEHVTQPLPRRPLRAPHLPGQHHAPGVAGHPSGEGTTMTHRGRASRGDREEAVQPRTDPEVRPEPHAAHRSRCPSRRSCCAWASPTCSAPTAWLGQGRRHPRRRRQRAVRQPAAALRRRRRHRHGEEGRRVDGLGRRRRLPRLQGRERRRLALRPARTGRRGGPGAHQLRRARRHPLRPHRRLPVAALLPHLAAALPRLLRWPAIRPDRHGVRDDDPRGAPRAGLPGVRRRPDGRRRVGRPERDRRRVLLRHLQPPAHPAGPAPHPQLVPVVPPRRVHARVRRAHRAGRHRALPLRRPHRRCLHDRLLPDHDVRPARSRPRDLRRRPSRSRRRPCSASWARPR